MRPSQEFSRICSLDLKGNETLEELRGSLRSWAGGLHVGSTLDKLEARLAGAPQLLQDLRLQLTDFADILDGCMIMGIWNWDTSDCMQGPGNTMADRFL